MEYFQWLFWAGLLGFYTWSQWQQGQRNQQQHRRAPGAGGGPAAAPSMASRLEQMMAQQQQQRQAAAGGSGGAQQQPSGAAAAAAAGGAAPATPPASADGRSHDPVHVSFGFGGCGESERAPFVPWCLGQSCTPQGKALFFSLTYKLRAPPLTARSPATTQPQQHTPKQNRTPPCAMSSPSTC
jgi:hypothetical protein